VDRLSLFKVLADRSRYAIYQEVVRAAKPLSTIEIAEQLHLHPNTVRQHLDKMRDVGLLTVFTDRHGSVGRPQHRWAACPQAPSLGLEPGGLRLLAHLLAELSAEGDPPASAVVGVGRRQGRERLLRRASPRAGSWAACVQEVMEELADLGFDPALDSPPDEQQASISFLQCPFREVAVLYPDVVCQLHRGITEGILAGTTGACSGLVVRVDSFASLVDADPCRVELSLRS
jgi:predicted ArsR family transcriptional regulator